MRRLRPLLAALALTGAPARASADCALALILALDVSGSVDPREWRLQTGGLASAFRHPHLVEAILGLDEKLRLAVTQWTGASRQKVTMPARRLGDAPGIAAAADALETMPRVWRHFSTAVGEALMHAVAYGEQGWADGCRRRVIDVSGDGVSNEGLPPAGGRAMAEAGGWTVNGLAIEGADPPVAPHYRAEMIVGPDAFVEVADGFEDYPRAILRKLLKEIRPEARIAGR